MESGFPDHPLIGLLLRLVYQHYAQDIEAALREAGFGDIRPAAANVFPFVPPEGITVSRLAELARVRKQSMAQAVDQLERTGYLERSRNVDSDSIGPLLAGLEADGLIRGDTHLDLTAQGEALHRSLREYIAGPTTRLLSQFDVHDIETTVRTVQAITERAAEESSTATG